MHQADNCTLAVVRLMLGTVAAAADMAAPSKEALCQQWCSAMIGYLRKDAA